MASELETLEEEFEAQQIIMEQLLEMVFRLQARVSAISEILIKEDITDPAELEILERDNLNTIEYSIARD